MHVREAWYVKYISQSAVVTLENIFWIYYWTCISSWSYQGRNHRSSRQSKQVPVNSKVQTRCFKIFYQAQNSGTFSFWGTQNLQAPCNRIDQTAYSNTVNNTAQQRISQQATQAVICRAGSKIWSLAVTVDSYNTIWEIQHWSCTNTTRRNKQQLLYRAKPVKNQIVCNWRFLLDSFQFPVHHLSSEYTTYHSTSLLLPAHWCETCFHVF